MLAEFLADRRPHVPQAIGINTEFGKCLRRRQRIVSIRVPEQHPQPRPHLLGIGPVPALIGVSRHRWVLPERFRHVLVAPR
jgi:hypothetical protein